MEKSKTLISDRIFEILKKQGMSQKEFSQRTGISQSTISDWKGKRLNPASDRIMLICDALKVTPYELLVNKEDENGQALYMTIDKKTDEYVLIEKYRDLNKDDRCRLMGYIEALLSK
ncbi:MAG: helix-turn-helix domain-containing protein [Clostridiales bacterium]|nr:helix-turn-helix domain-containing protein [Clostridiales bacterium]